jgi:hypothetical protein
MPPAEPIKELVMQNVLTLVFCFLFMDYSFLPSQIAANFSANPGQWNPVPNNLASQFF